MNAPYDKHRMVRITGIDHSESISVGPRGEVYTTGTGCQVYRVDLATNTAEQFAATANRCLGQVVDADGNLYCAETVLGEMIRITPKGDISTYATDPGGHPFVCTNYPAFERDIMLAASLDNLVLHRMDDTGVVGLPLNHPSL